ncbi:Rv3235 family protein [Cellulosimicrobium arenosum]|uniref:Energy transducer TonB n=1 Tax=Cellulosimicrobium arenosum TaxID=2708133 RepID=A0A927J2M0_9MICO|nr:Rv3235 family protein [Cellulosimicrobium arenosum]MBD8080713.1 energy transducer TonB [Cellulosimicrobium arenosum]
MTAPTVTSFSAPSSTTRARTADVPAAPSPARLLRCIGERAAPEIDTLAPHVPQHLVRRRPLGEATAPGPVADPRALCCAVVRAAVEVLRGERTVHQLARWVTPEIYDALARRARLVVDARALTPVTAGAPEPTTRPVSVRRARVVRLGESVAEATVVVQDGDRVRAAAARLELRRGVWRVVVLEIG